jgi:hypothetical protein
MENITRIHEKILDHLLQLRKVDNGLYFVPRKINKKKRLDKGYWFLGDENYLHLSFWDGGDWKEKIHNIGFVILRDKTSYIEFSAQDSSYKASFLALVANKLVGFKKDENKNKWRKYYSGKDYIKNLDEFIFNTKPIIDKLIIARKPKGINLLNKFFFDNYTKKIIENREKQIQFGEKNKLSKICWNTENWKFPSGSQGKSVSVESYEAGSGYGHEEWLFDKSKIIDGYHYAFLQPLNIKTDRHENKVYNISLFTTNNRDKQYFAGEIRNVECISSDESARVYNIYKANGWIEKMREDIQMVGANYKKFNETPPEIFFNIRFKFQDVILSDELIEIAKNDINITTNHYRLLPLKSEIIFAIHNDYDEDDEGNKRNTNKRRKVFNGECEYDPYHDQMQNAIFDLLNNSKQHCGYEKIFIEKGRVDIKARTQEGTWHYFELKTDNAKQSIRKALGQILEYAFFPDENKAEKLIIVSDEIPNEDIIKYLNHIRTLFGLPIFYKYFNLEKNELSDDY